MSTKLSGSLLLTFRELWSTYVTLGLFAVTTLAWVLASFAMNLDVVEGSIAGLRIFGLDATPSDAVQDQATGEWSRVAMSLDNFVVGIQSFVVGAAYMLGTLLGVFATAPLTANLMKEPRIGLLLSKPLSRHSFLAGHVLGVMLTVLSLASYLVLSVWIVLSLKSGLWHFEFLLSIPLITIMFLVMYSVVLLAAVTTGSSGFALVGAYGLIFVSMILAGHEGILTQLNEVGTAIFMTFYYVLPNFIESLVITVQLVGEQSVESWTPFIASVGFGLAVYFLAFRWFARKDF
ncbi:MAG: hypothetical protein JJ896_14175 [Rhodothermales bacterium]|nr:hypothetical protein [Rhodothermales bacterium]MBO6780796.1 hypothetical protein [Rhodothermales bacterium]